MQTTTGGPWLLGRGPRPGGPNPHLIWPTTQLEKLWLSSGDGSDRLADPDLRFSSWLAATKAASQPTPWKEAVGGES
ncbi:MAG: hypothetical protein ACKO8I_06205, partial [Cyanobacteriota bacterium]